jgi:hypothetical protein
MPAAAYRAIVDTYFGTSPYRDFVPDRGTASPHGWGQDNPIFEHLIDEIRPQVIVQVGAWLGASAIRMAGLLGQRGIMFGDDFVGEWPGVVQAVRLFADKLETKAQLMGEKWALRKS